MIIHDHDLRCAGRALGPFETDPPLGVDTDAELSVSIAFQGSETVARQGVQIINSGRGIKHFESFVSLSIEALKLAHKLPAGERLGPFIAIVQGPASKNSRFDDLRQP